MPSNQELVAGVDEERRHLARELHDGLGQYLTALLAGLRVIEATAELQRVKVLARRLTKITRSAHSEIGRISRGLNPTILDDFGLQCAVERLLEDFKAVNSVAVDARVALGDSSLPIVVQTTIYRVLQELLTNVARHAEAKHVTVIVKVDSDVSFLSVQDDGVGFDPKSQRGMGLRNIEYRAKMLGGSSEICSSPGHSAVISVSIPVQDHPLHPEGGKC